jgi:hypothetical protein
MVPQMKQATIRPNATVLVMQSLMKYPHIVHIKMYMESSTDLSAGSVQSAQ